MIKLNNQLVQFGSFPNGETKVDETILDRLVSCDGLNILDFKYENDADLIQLLFMKKFLDDKIHSRVFLNIAYMPYSRMDRMEADSFFTLKHVADFINSLGFDGVMVQEAHSDVTPALLNRCGNMELSAHVLNLAIIKTGFDKERDYLFYPDAGAQKRYSKLGDYKELVGLKKRNFTTGRIESLQAIGDLEPGRKVIIVDDLCSYGGTFYLSAQALKQKGAGDVYLAVAHCENSIFKGSIPGSDLITRVFTTDSILNESTDEKVEVVYSFNWKDPNEEPASAMTH